MVKYVILLRFGPEVHHTGFHLKGKEYLNNLHIMLMEAKFCPRCQYVTTHPSNDFYASSLWNDSRSILLHTYQVQGERKMGSFVPHKIPQKTIKSQKRVKIMGTKVPGIMLMHTKYTKKPLVPPKPKVSNHPPLNQYDISSITNRDLLISFAPHWSKSPLIRY